MNLHEYENEWFAGIIADAKDWFETLRFDEPDAEARVASDMWDWWLALTANA